MHNYVFELRVKICRKTLGSIAFHDCSFQSQGEMQVQAESDTSNCYNSFIKGYYFLLHLFEILMDEYTCNSQLAVLQLLSNPWPILPTDLCCCIPTLATLQVSLESCSIVPLYTSMK